MTCNLFQGSKLFSEKSIKLDTANGNIALDHSTKTQDCLVSGIKIIHEYTSKKAHVSEEDPVKKNKKLMH